MARRLIMVALLLVASGANVKPTKGPADRRLVERAAAIDVWFQQHSREYRAAHKGGKAFTPPNWTVRKAGDVPQPWHEIGNQSIAKRVFRARVGSRSVVVKRAIGVRSGPHRGEPKGADLGGSVIYLELVYLEALRGAPGVPELLGGWFDGPHVYYVLSDGGERIGRGVSKGVGTAPTVLSDAFRTRAAKQPLQLARSLLACFQSWTAAGFLEDDFKAEQFTLDGNGQIYLVDGPHLRGDSLLGEAVARTWPHRGAANMLNRDVRTCAQDADCPFTKENHSCRGAGTCEPGARGAPEARGKCVNNKCMRLSDKTHIYDVANRPWLLPAIADAAEDAASKAFLRGLIRLAGRGQPEERPSFQELLDRVDRFIAKPLPQTPGPKERLYKSSVIQDSAHRRKSFWDYASVSFTDLGKAGGVRVRDLIQGLCEDRGLTCWESQVEGHGKEIPKHYAPKRFREVRVRNRGSMPKKFRGKAGALDVLYGQFYDENPTLMWTTTLPPEVFAFTVVSDAWRVVRSSYYDRHEDLDDLDAFVNASFPHGVQRHAQRLAGMQYSRLVAVTRSQCDRALRNLDAFDLIVDAASLAGGGLRDLAALLYGLYDVDAPEVASPKPVGDLAASPAAKARVLEESWCHSEIYAAARQLPAFVAFSS
ncbi:unnamed protein product [Pelagomonas calceolata]|uniref:Uncharacterized protein n=2 Tax=Pelagomonas calceolata TaxID=35677 RepID=A0A8J2WNQ2_9STRA|nr:unnamed protein product [Pelagomonas calceolata]